MSQSLKKLLIILFFFSAGLTAQGGIYIEPHLGYHVIGDETSNDNSFNGFAYGLRAGFAHMGLLAGIGYEMGDVTIDANSGDIDASMSDLYAFIGYKFPVLVRVWGGYSFQSNVDQESGHADLEGKGLRMGVGYSGFPFISINLEYQRRDDFEQKINGVTTDSDHKFTSWVLSVSYPLEF